MLEHSQKFNLGDSVKSINRILTRQIKDIVDRSEKLTALLNEFLIEKVEAGIAVELNIEIVYGLAI